MLARRIGQVRARSDRALACVLAWMGGSSDRIVLDAKLRALRQPGCGVAPVLTRSLRFAAGCGFRAGPGPRAVLASMASRRLAGAAFHTAKDFFMHDASAHPCRRLWVCTLSADRRWALISDAQGRNIAELHRPPLSTGPLGRSLTFEQTAQLMAAAPELLELLRETVAPGGIGSHEFTRPGGYRERALALLASVGSAVT